MKIILVCFLSCYFASSSSAPVQQLIPVGIINNEHYVQRDPISNWIQSSEWFPIQINVPDTISGIGQSLSNFGSGVATWAQGIPFINRLTSQFNRPRPFKYMLVMAPPSVPQSQPQVVHHLPGNHHFNPFDGVDSNFLPSYP